MAAQNETAGSDIMSLVERTIQRNLKGLELLGAPEPSVGPSPKDQLYRRGTMILDHYRPMTDELYRVPVLMVMATTNRSYIFDLAPGNSLIEFLLKRGFDVYVLHWDNPRSDEAGLRLDDYVLDFIAEAVRRVQVHSGVDDVSLIGYCMGGVLSSIYAALHQNGPLKNLVCFTTPIDFTKMELFSRWSDQRYFDVDKLVDSVGIVPASMMLESFSMLRPADRFTTPIRMFENVLNDEVLIHSRRIVKWSNDQLPLAGEYFRQSVKDLLWENKLLKGDLRLGGKVADLRNITIPTLHIVAQHDHIVPYEASRPLIEMVGAKDKEELLLKGGHVSIVGGANALKRVWPKLDQWLSVRST